MLIISYASRDLVERCTKLEQAQDWLGPTDAQALIDMLADAEAMENVQALIEFHDATVQCDGSLSINFSPRHRAILQPIGPAATGQGRNWTQLRRLKLLEILEL